MHRHVEGLLFPRLVVFVVAALALRRTRVELLGAPQALAGRASSQLPDRRVVGVGVDEHDEFGHAFFPTFRNKGANDGRGVLRQFEETLVHAAGMGISGRMAGLVHAAPLLRHNEDIATFPGPHRPELGVVAAVLLATSDWVGVDGSYPHGSHCGRTARDHAPDFRHLRGVDLLCLDFECVHIYHKLNIFYPCCTRLHA